MSDVVGATDAETVNWPLLVDGDKSWRIPPDKFSTLMAHGLLGTRSDGAYRLCDTEELESDPGSAGVNNPKALAVLAVVRAALSAARARSAIPETEAVAWPPIVELGRTLGFFASVIKSGEDWSQECTAAYDRANLAIQQLYRDVTATHPVLPDREGFAAALRWAMDEIDVLSNKISGFAYPQGMGMIGRRSAANEDGYENAVRVRRALAASPATGEREPSRATDTAVDQGRAKP